MTSGLSSEVLFTQSYCHHLCLGMYEVGVLIADVSHFVQGASDLDSVAADRATSIYLVQKVRQMTMTSCLVHFQALNVEANRRC